MMKTGISYAETTAIAEYLAAKNDDMPAETFDELCESAWPTHAWDGDYPVAEIRHWCVNE